MLNRPCHTEETTTGTCAPDKHLPNPQPPHLRAVGEVDAVQSRLQPQPLHSRHQPLPVPHVLAQHLGHSCRQRREGGDGRGGGGEQCT